MNEAEHIDEIAEAGAQWESAVRAYVRTWGRPAAEGVVTADEWRASEAERSARSVYETARDIRHATRWYENGLLVERIVQDSFRGSWSLSPTGAGPTVEIAANFSWDENFVVPGDLSSDVETSQGSQFRVQGLGAVFIDSGRYLPDGTHHGYASAFSDAAIAVVCNLLTA